MSFSLYRATVALVVFSLSSLLHAEAPRIAPALSELVASKQQDPEAEVLTSIRHATLNQDGSWQSRWYLAIRVNSQDAARDYGRISIPYNHYYTSMELEFANTLNKNAELKSVLESAIQNRITGGGQDFYSDRSELVFSLPDIEPGSVIEFQYTKTSKINPLEGLYSPVSMPHWFQSTAANDGWRADYVHRHEFRLQTPKTVELYTKRFSGFNAKEKTSTKNEVRVTTWVSKNIAKIKHEPYMSYSEMVAPQLKISTLNDWSAVNVWAWETVADKLEKTAAIKAVLQDLPVTLDSPAQEKIEAVYEYIQRNIRYVFAHLGRGGYEPHFPDETLEAGYGDCKDQAVLAVALLRALGVQAFPALIETPRGGKSSRDVVALIFDHMIVHVPEQSGVENQWLDTTGDRSLFPGISNYLVDQNVLVVNEKQGVFTSIDAKSLDENTVHVKTHYSVDNNDQIVADVEFILSGTLEQNMRQWWVYEKDKENKLQQFLKGFYNTALDFTVTGTVENTEDMFKPVSVNAQYRFEKDETAEYPAAAASIAQLVNVYFEPASLPAPVTRVNRFRDPYIINIQYDITFDGGKKYLPALVQSADGFKNRYFSLDLNTKQEEAIFTVEFNFTRNKLDLDLAEYEDYYEAVNNIVKYSPWVVSMRPRLESVVKASVEDAASKYGEDSVHYYIAKANGDIDKGNVGSALKAARKAVEIDASNGQAWYVLGKAQGLNALFEESSKSFAKGESLGYQP